MSTSDMSDLTKNDLIENDLTENDRLLIADPPTLEQRVAHVERRLDAQAEAVNIAKRMATEQDVMLNLQIMNTLLSAVQLNPSTGRASRLWDYFESLLRTVIAMRSQVAVQGKLVELKASPDKDPDKEEEGERGSE